MKPFLLLTGLLTAAALRATDTTYLFTYFTGNGEDGLHLAWSEDGYRWQTLNDDRSILAPQVGKDRLMRDPCVTRGPDGTYHLVWTTGWWDRSIGHASTRDFLSWSKQTALPVMESELAARNAWAPETIVYFDIYREQRYGAMRSRDLVQWEDVTAEVSVPPGARHGTMIAVPRSLVDRLREVWPSPVRPAAPAVVPAPDLGANPEATARLRDPKLPTVFVAGDSTAAKNNGEPIQGWGEPFHDYFDPAKINVVNRARGGRSSRTFITEGLWDALLAEVKAGDFVLIQFGHNDAGAINAEPPGSTRPLRARGSLPGLGDGSEEIENVLTHRHEVVHTFGWYVRKMIADVKARGATPILLSLTVRNNWTGGKVERRSGEYRAWDQAIARGSGIDFVDLTRIVADRYQELGEEKTRAFFAADHTHTVPAGADFNAAAVVAGLMGLRGGPWVSLLSAKGCGVPADSIGWLNLPEPANPALPTLLLIGDSTVRNGCGDGAGGQWGWGDALPAHLDISKLNVVNRAVGGLSSRTFLTQGHWERALTLLKRGDFLLMQFGHNDDSALNDEKRARGTIKGVGEETQEIDNQLTKQHEAVHSYGWYLRRFIREAKARGATPIVCSPVPRKVWKDGKIVRSAEGYAGWSRQVAAEEGAAFIDLNDLVAHRYEALGVERVEAMFADGHTHTSRAGAELTAAVVADALRKLPGIVFQPSLRGP